MTQLIAHQQLFDAAKGDALPGVWSQAVKLARVGSIVVESLSPGEVVLRIPVAGRALAPTVVLYPEDSEWACDCGGRNDPCEHALAGVIALHQGQLEAPSAASPATKLCYRLSIEEQRLKVRRFLRTADGDQELSEPLTSSIAQGACPFSPSEHDIHVDRLLSAVPRSDFKLDQVYRLLKSLAELDVELDNQPIRVNGQPLKPLGSVRDQGDRIVLSVVRPPELERVLAPGVALAAGELRPIGAVDVGGLRMEHLPLERSLGLTETHDLVERVLPELSKSIYVDIQSRRLPERNKTLKPWIFFDLSHQGHALSVLPKLVYGDPPIARVDGERLVLLGETAPRRDRSLENELGVRLRDHLELAFGRRVDFEGEAAARFVERLRRFANQTGSAQTSLARVMPLVARVTLGAESFEVAFEGEAVSGQAAQRADTGAVLKAFRDGSGLVPLEGGGFGSIPRQWLEQHAEQITTLLAARTPSGAVLTYVLPTLGKLSEALGQPPPPELSRLAPLFEGFEALPPLRLPADLTATLRPYQQDAVRWLCFLRSARLGAVLADDMGLGKTLQTLCAVTGKTLVICPKSVLFNWEREIARFRPHLRTSIYHGPRRQLDRDADIVLTTYSVLRLDISELAKCGWDCAVLDEAQAIKNPTSQVSQAAFQLQADFRVALSGTPVENRLEELWSIFRFTHPGLLGSRSSFEQRFANPISEGNAIATDRLRELTKPFLLRRLKKVVAKDLPPRTDVVLPIELDTPEQQLYDAILAATQADVVRELEAGGSVMRALEALLRLRQAACHSGLLPGHTARSSSKTDALLEALVDVTLNGHKALVFSQWTSFLDVIEPHLLEAGIPFLRLDGSTRDRAGVVSQFQDDSGPPVLLASLKAGGTGLNLTQADHVFLMDPWYNPAAEDQAADRAHRIGQERPVMVYKLVAKGTIEEGIINLQDKKRRLADAALTGAEAATKITRDDLLSLLKA